MCKQCETRARIVVHDVVPGILQAAGHPIIGGADSRRKRNLNAACGVSRRLKRIFQKEHRIKYAIVPFSKISTHPFQSLLPADYLGDPGYIKELLADLTPSNQKRIQWMVAEKIVTEEQLKAYVEEMAHAVLKKPMELAEKYRQTLQGLLSPGESAGTD